MLLGHHLRSASTSRFR